MKKFPQHTSSLRPAVRRRAQVQARGSGADLFLTQISDTHVCYEKFGCCNFNIIVEHTNHMIRVRCVAAPVRKLNATYEHASDGQNYMHSRC